MFVKRGYVSAPSEKKDTLVAEIIAVKKTTYD